MKRILFLLIISFVIIFMTSSCFLFENMSNNNPPSHSRNIDYSPTSVSVEFVPPDKVEITWKDNHPSEAGYRIYYKTEDEENYNIVKSLPANTEKAEIQIEVNKKAYVKVAAYDKSGRIYFSETVAFIYSYMPKKDIKIEDKNGETKLIIPKEALNIPCNNYFIKREGSRVIIEISAATSSTTVQNSPYLEIQAATEESWHLVIPYITLKIPSNVVEKQKLWNGLYPYFHKVEGNGEILFPAIAYDKEHNGILHCWLLENWRFVNKVIYNFDSDDYYYYPTYAELYRVLLPDILKIKIGYYNFDDSIMYSEKNIKISNHLKSLSELRKKAIIFIHGHNGIGRRSKYEIGSHSPYSNRTWSEFFNVIKYEWPIISHYFDFYEYIYDTNTMTAQDFGTVLGRLMEKSGILDQYDEIFLIAHSMGGLVARYAMNTRLSEKASNYVGDYVNKLITLNTPHHGSPLQNLAVVASRDVGVFEETRVTENLIITLLDDFLVLSSPEVVNKIDEQTLKYFIEKMADEIVDLIGRVNLIITLFTSRPPYYLPVTLGAFSFSYDNKNYVEELGEYMDYPDSRWNSKLYNFNNSDKYLRKIITIYSSFENIEMDKIRSDEDERYLTILNLALQKLGKLFESRYEEKINDGMVPVWSQKLGGKDVYTQIYGGKLSHAEIFKNRYVINKVLELISHSSYYSISGYVKDEVGRGLKNVKIEFETDTFCPLPTETDENGFWKKDNLIGRVKVIPKKEGCSFDPPYRIVDGEKNHVDFIAICPNNPEKKYNLVVITSPDQGLTVKVDNKEYISPVNLAVDEGYHTIEVIETQFKDTSKYVSGDDTKYIFNRWSDNHSRDNHRRVYVQSDVTYTAEMDVKYYIDFEVIGKGHVDKSDGYWDMGSVLKVKATPDQGYEFDHWEVNGKIVTSNPLIIHEGIYEPKKIIAVFKTSNKVSITVDTSPDQGLDIKLDGVTYQSPKSVEWYTGSKHTIEVVTPQERDKSSFVSGNDTRYTFLRWDDGNTNYSREITVPNTNWKYVAEMKVEYYVKYEILEKVSGQRIGGRVDKNDGYVEKDAQISVKAIPDQGYEFDHWEVNGVKVRGNPLSLTVDEPKKVVAVFKRKAPKIEWELNLGGTGEDELYDVDVVNSAFFVAAGGTKSPGIPGHGGGKDAWIVEIEEVNGKGTLHWQKAYDGGNSYDDEAFSIKSVGNDYIFVGRCESISDIALPQSDLWVVELPQDRKKQDKKFGGFFEDDKAYGVLVDGEYYVIVGGGHGDGNNWQEYKGGYEGWILKIQRPISNHEPEFSTPCWYGNGYKDDLLYTIKEDTVAPPPYNPSPYMDRNTEDGKEDHTYIAVGYTENTRNGGKDGWIIRVDSRGNILDNKVYGGSGNDEFHDIIVTDDGYVVVGTSDSHTDTHKGGKDVWIVKLRQDLSIEWEKHYGGSSDDEGWRIAEADDGYVIAGLTRSSDGDISYNHGGTDGWLLKIYKDGRIKWEKTLGGSRIDKLMSVKVLQDGKYIAVGYTESNDGDVSNNYGNFDGWVVKLGRDP